MKVITNYINEREITIDSSILNIEHEICTWYDNLDDLEWYLRKPYTIEELQQILIAIEQDDWLFEYLDTNEWILNKCSFIYLINMTEHQFLDEFMNEED